MRWLLLLMIVLWTGVAKAQNTDLNAAATRYVFEQWAQEVGAQEISFVALHNGTEAGAPLNADRPFDLASLSKAITAICAAGRCRWARKSPQTPFRARGAQTVAFSATTKTMLSLAR